MAPYPVLVLQNDPREGLGTLQAALDRAGLKAHVLEMWNGDRVPSTVSGYRALVILGGPQSVTNAAHVQYLQQEMRAVREAHATRTPVLGICLGAQLVAEALGGKVFQGGAPEVGWEPVVRTDAGREDKLLSHLPDDLPVCHWHEDTFTLPPLARRLAETPAYENQAFVVDYAEGVPGDTYGLQFHIEWTPEIVARLSADEEWDVDGAPARAMEAAAARVFDAFLTECGCND